MIRSARSVSSNGSAASDGALRQGTRAEILRNFSTLSPGLIAFPLLHFSGFVPGRMPGSSHSVAFFQILKACPSGTFSGLGRGGFPPSARFPGSLQSAAIPIIFELYRRPPRAREIGKIAKILTFFGKFCKILENFQKSAKNCKMSRILGRILQKMSEMCKF